MLYNLWITKIQFFSDYFHKIWNFFGLFSIPSPSCSTTVAPATPTTPTTTISTPSSITSVSSSPTSVPRVGLRIRSRVSLNKGTGEKDEQTKKKKIFHLKVFKSKTKKYTFIKDCLRSFKNNVIKAHLRMPFPHAFSALHCDFQIITLVSPNQGKY